MFDLAARFGSLDKGGTPSNIGPNSYIICEGREPVLRNAVPFLSSTGRKLRLNSEIYTDTIFNPDDTLVKRRVTGGSTLRNKAIRLRYPKGDTPGPADYDPKKIEKGCKYKPPLCHGKGKLFVCRVPYTVFASSPSVPTHIDENGYNVDEYGNLVKCPPDPHDRTLGPAFYDVPRGEICFTTLKYHKGCQWSKSKTKRKTMPISDTPPPGAYDPKLNPCTKTKHDEEYRELARYFSFFPRFTEAEMLRITREGLPGPGYYNVNASSFQCPKSLSINPRPFIVKSERFSSNLNSDKPGPATYEICDAVTKQQQFSTKCVPFGIQSRRFSATKTATTPGPASYDIKSPLVEKLCSKINKYSAVDVPFYRTSERKMGFASPEAEFLPGPGEYDVEKPEVEKEEVSASFFKSRTARFRRSRTKEDGGPASYNISEQFNKNHNRRSHNTGKVPFLSSQSRTSGRRRKTEFPGPADYMGAGKMGTKGLSFSVSPRFKDLEKRVPGPALLGDVFDWLHLDTKWDAGNVKGSKGRGCDGTNSLILLSSLVKKCGGNEKQIWEWIKKKYFGFYQYQ
ncbi:hypothetical protein ILUMI_24492 [Ignelater luminosus]|uniref:Sperm-tail PG-rich repeat-containing protein 2 n=1 Tax=Ignelater luminosus TaxID=2038154 RepID=A0A8K0CDA2_IGNLU|nr:hypothetical protein ILUMI_24492 [Ignelater luminosus]